MKEKPAHIIKRYAKDITSYINKIPASFSSRYIHGTRTTFKKLRAVLRWQKKPAGTWRSFKVIYQAAGELRNLQVAVQILKKKKRLPAAFFSWMKTLTGKAEKKWKKIATEKSLSHFTKNLEQLKIKPLNNKAFFHKNLYSIGATIYPDPVLDTSLHEVRKKIKDIQYVLKTIKKKNMRKAVIKNIPTGFLKKAAARIGNYNDKKISLLLLTAYANQEKVQVRINKTNAVIDRLSRNKTIEKEKLITYLLKCIDNF